MRSKVLSFLLVLLGLMGGAASCSSDHDHDMGYYDYHYDYPYYNDQPYYYYNGHYYADIAHLHPYAWDDHHFYSARIEWKGSAFGYAIVLRENPYHGMICRPTNFNHFFPYAPRDGEVMVRFRWLGEENHNGLIIPVIEIVDIHYK